MIFQDPMTSLNPIVSVGDQIMEVLDLHAPGMSRHEKSERVDGSCRWWAYLPHARRSSRISFPAA